MNKERLELGNIVDQRDVTDTYRIFQPITKE